jgi:phosphatidylglycerol:prolipoprotein diacylglycerol transferase
MWKLVITIPWDPVFQLGPLPVHWYGVGYAFAIAVGWMVGLRYLQSHGIGEERLGSLGVWAVILGLIAGRLYYVVQSGLGYYVTHPLHVFAFWEGGMAFYGAVFAVPIVIAVFCRRRQLPLWIVLDSAALFASIGQTIGRIGNIVNGDIVGYPSNLPWAVRYTDPHSLAPVHGVAYQPAAVYELVFSLALFAFLFWLGTRRPRAGTLIIGYVGLYAIGQFFLFFLRDNVVFALGLRQAQLTSLAVLLVGVPLLVLLRNRWPHAWANGLRGRETFYRATTPIETGRTAV